LIISESIFTKSQQLDRIQTPDTSIHVAGENGERRTENGERRKGEGEKGRRGERENE
jgi:hypothetical protein